MRCGLNAFCFGFIIFLWSLRSSKPRLHSGKYAFIIPFSSIPYISFSHPLSCYHPHSTYTCTPRAPAYAVDLLSLKSILWLWLHILYECKGSCEREMPRPFSVNGIFAISGEIPFPLGDLYRAISSLHPLPGRETNTN